MSIAMRFMLTQTFGRGDETTMPITEWSPEDIAAHIEFQQVLNDELTRLGELVGAEGLASPEAAKLVVTVCDPRRFPQLASDVAHMFAEASTTLAGIKREAGDQTPVGIRAMRGAGAPASALSRSARVIGGHRAVDSAV